MVLTNNNKLLLRLLTRKDTPDTSRADRGGEGKGGGEGHLDHHFQSIPVMRVSVATRHALWRDSRHQMMKLSWMRQAGRLPPELGLIPI